MSIPARPGEWQKLAQVFARQFLGAEIGEPESQHARLGCRSARDRYQRRTQRLSQAHRIHHGQRRHAGFSKREQARLSLLTLGTARQPEQAAGTTETIPKITFWR